MIPSEPPDAGLASRTGPITEPAGAAPSAKFEVMSDTLQVLEEVLQISKRDVVTGRVRVSTRTELRDETAEIPLDRSTVDVTRVPIGQTVDTAPAVRTENGVTIVPVVEERFVVVKQLVLVEEVHIRNRVDTAVERVPVQLRRQTAVVERIDAAGHVTAEPDAPG